MNTDKTREKIFEAITTERARQDKKHGADRNLHPIEWMGILGEEYGEACKEANDYHWENDEPTEVLFRYRKEMIEAAAVIVSALECLERNWQSEVK